jgi:hypothetical protein
MVILSSPLYTPYPITRLILIASVVPDDGWSVHLKHWMFRKLHTRFISRITKLARMKIIKTQNPIYVVPYKISKDFMDDGCEIICK